MPLTGIGAQEVSQQETSTAWIILITVNPPSKDEPIRVTSDSVPTISQGNLFDPFPFMVTLPDDVEGRSPQAQLRIDNTDQQIISRLRGLPSPAMVTIQIVRASNPDVIEREWTDIQWISSDYDAGMITGSLSVDDLATEEFPYITFDGRFRGLWP